MFTAWVSTKWSRRQDNPAKTAATTQAGAAPSKPLPAAVGPGSALALSRMGLFTGPSRLAGAQPRCDHKSGTPRGRSRQEALDEEYHAEKAEPKAHEPERPAAREHRDGPDRDRNLEERDAAGKDDMAAEVLLGRVLLLLRLG